MMLAAAGFAMADEATDRASIERSVAALNDFRKAPEARGGSSVITETVKADLNALSAVDGTSEPAIWSELSQPRIAVSAIQFSENGVAVILASDTRYGSLNSGRSIPLLIIAKRAGEQWIVTSVKVVPTN